MNQTKTILTTVVATLVGLAVLAGIVCLGTYLYNLPDTIFMKHVASRSDHKLTITDLNVIEPTGTISIRDLHVDNCDSEDQVNCDYFLYLMVPKDWEGKTDPQSFYFLTTEKMEGIWYGPFEDNLNEMLEEIGDQKEFIE